MNSILRDSPERSIRVKIDFFFFWAIGEFKLEYS